MTPKAREFISKKIRIHAREGFPIKQAIAMAYSKARAKGFRMPPRTPTGSPKWVRKAYKEGKKKGRRISARDILGKG